MAHSELKCRLQYAAWVSVDQPPSGHARCLYRSKDPHKELAVRGHRTVCWAALPFVFMCFRGLMMARGSTQGGMDRTGIATTPCLGQGASTLSLRLAAV